MTDNNQSYQWRGLNTDGKHVAGIIYGASSKDVQVELKRMGIEVTDLTLTRTIGLGYKRRKKIKPADVLLFTRFLSTMISAGMPIMQALDVIAHDQENEVLQSLVVSVKNDVASGKTLAEAFSKYPKIFPDIYCNLVKAGEKSGTLDTILKRLASYLERTENLKRKIRKALVYPAAIVSVAMVVSLILLFFVVPRFQEMFTSFGAKLPYFTLMIIHLSDFLRGYWWLLILLIIGAVYSAKSIIKNNSKAREKIDLWSLKIFIIGPVLKKGIIARYTRTLAITLDAGMPIIEAMKSMSAIMGNSIYSRAVLEICDSVVSGHPLSTSMSNTKLFPNMVIQMISVGEASGALAEMLNKIADYYEEEVNSTVENLSSLLEPLIMALLGIIIGGFVVAMYLPIFRIGSLF